MNEEEFRRVLERIATALEQIALDLKHPRIVVQDDKPLMARASDRLMREQARCPRCYGYHNQLAACLT